MITREYLLERLAYDPDTGVFTWKNGPRSGKTLRVGPKGYVLVKLQKKLYVAHRLAWLYVTGSWPSAAIDHRNGDRSDNRLSNLREASDTENQWNKAPFSNTHSKWKGVTYDSGRKKCWKMAFKMPDGSRIQRRYEDEREAAEEYIFLALEHHGEFARFD